MKSLSQRLDAVLKKTSAKDFDQVLVANMDGLVVAARDPADEQQLSVAAFSCLFQEILERASSDLGFVALDEVTLLDASRRRYLLRPLGDDLVLLASVSPRRPWRRSTNILLRNLRELLVDPTPTT